jgi:hypothetical protein
MALRKKFQAPSINLQASVNDSIDSLNFDITNNGTIRLLRQSCGEVLVNQEGIKFCGNGKRSDTDTHYQVSSRDICEFQVCCYIHKCAHISTFFLVFVCNWKLFEVIVKMPHKSYPQFISSIFRQI